MSTIQPYILGHGRAGLAAAKSLAMLAVDEPELALAPVRWLERGAPLPDVRHDDAKAVLIVSNPHGLHAEAILAAETQGFAAVVSEKPAAVTLDQVALLRKVRIPVGVFHVYRQTWGVNTLRQMIQGGELGSLITIEGRYWQASTAERALAGPPATAGNWKNHTKLSGPYDVWLDIGSHWIDAAVYLVGRNAIGIDAWRSFANAEAPHRDSHVQAAVTFPGGPRAAVSISKTMHGATNHFELVALGTKAAATWTFLNPDEILVGQGRERRVVTRKAATLGTHFPPFHGSGWLEGYIEILRQVLTGLSTGTQNYPTLVQSLDHLELMLRTNWQQS